MQYMVRKPIISMAFTYLFLVFSAGQSFGERNIEGQLEIDVCGEDQSNKFILDVSKASLVDVGNIDNCWESLGRRSSIEQLNSLEAYLRPKEIFSAVYFGSEVSSSFCVVGKPYSLETPLTAEAQELASKRAQFFAVRYNSSRSHAVLVDMNGSATHGSLINLSARELITPICSEKARVAEWSPDGRYIAYAVSEDSNLRADSWRRLVVFSTAAQQIVVDRVFASVVDDITWSPSSQFIALLSWDSEVSVNPLNWLNILSGHGKYYREFNLEIFDIGGDVREEYRQFVTGVANGRGQIKWSQIEDK